MEELYEAHRERAVIRHASFAWSQPECLRARTKIIEIVETCAEYFHFTVSEF
jgi:hypothetical protein